MSNQKATFEEDVKAACINRDDLDNIVQDVFGCISPTECHGFGTVFQVAEIAL